MSQAAKVQEPSMEEILSSIRRIIAEDDSAKASEKASQTAEPVAKPSPASSQAASRGPAAARPAPSAAAANSQHRIDAILAELDAPLKAVSKAVPAEPEEAEETEDEHEALEPAPTSFRTIDPAADVVFAERPAEPPPEPYPAYEAPRQASPGPDRALISSATLSAVDSAFNSLAHTVIGQNARTLEDLVKEMLRPLLKVWLDDNLPGLVERIVRAEIERVSRGRR